jgi:hypothetical protein
MVISAITTNGCLQIQSQDIEQVILDRCRLNLEVTLYTSNVVIVVRELVGVWPCSVCE